MKKKNVIILILCVLVAAVIALNATGVIGSPQGSTPTASFAGWQDAGKGHPSCP